MNSQPEGLPHRHAAIHAALEAFGRAGLLAALRRLGLPPAADMPLGTASALAAQLGIGPQHARLFAALLNIGARAGWLAGVAQDTLETRAAAAPDLAAAARRLRLTYPEVDGTLALLEACLDGLPDVLTGRRRAVEVLFPGGSMALVSAAYGDNPVADHYNSRIARLLSDYVALRLKRDPAARITILEVGAGTGGTSAGALNALDPFAPSLRYLYTDVSDGFLRAAEAKFRTPARAYLEFLPLDLERDPLAQGFAPASVDVVIGTNVLHAVRRLDATIGYLKRVMRKNALLVASEATELREFSTLTFGLTEGWWHFEDAGHRLPDGPLLSAEGWRGLLTRCGFNNVVSRGRPGEGWHLIAGESDGHAPAEQAGAQEMRPAPPWRATAPTDVAPKDDEAAMLGFLRGVFAQVLEMPEARLEANALFEEFGIDSLVNVQITRRLEEGLGRLPASLLFEATTLEGLAKRLVRDHKRTAPAPEPLAVTPEPEPARPPAPAPTHAAPKEDVAAMLGFLRGVFAQVLEMPQARLEANALFEEFGIDSLVNVQITRRLEEGLGRLPASLLFEATTLEGLAKRLVNDHKRTAPAPAAAKPEVASAQPAFAPAPPPLAAPAVISPQAAPEDAPVAIIGLAGRYPGAEDLDGFWANLLAGRSAIGPVPADRWPAPPAGGARYGAFLDHIDRFDPLFFRIAPREAEAMDPQERLFLETAWHALEDAGLTRAALARAPVAGSVGVFAGVMNNGYEWLGAAAATRGMANGAHAAHWSVANRVSYLFDLNGPSMAVDTACSSSLTAVHLAVEALRRGECRMALAGGVNLIVAPAQLERLERLGMLAPDGVCRPFGKGGAGMVDGEGVGIAVLRPLADAQAAGDRILAVIRGSAVNAGGRTAGYTVPNPLAQAAVVRRALARAGHIDPATISYVEAHGTGTPLGDPVEIAGLADAWRVAGAQDATCRVGSVKGNIGHLESAAGIASLTKLVLQMQHSTIAPSLHAEVENPGLALAQTPFRIAVEAAPWQAAGLPLRAGLSSFGAGGANAHLVLEAAPPAPVRPFSPEGPVALVLSAQDGERLRICARRLADHLESLAGRDLPLADVAHTLQTGREAMEARRAAWVASRQEALAVLRRWADGMPDDAAPHPGPLLASWLAGETVDWPAPPGARRVRLPAYPFAGERYWINGLTAAPIPAAPIPAAPIPAAAQPAADHRHLAQWLIALLAEVVGVAPARIRADKPFDAYGLDSVLMLDLVGRMEARLGPLPKTLLFEYPTIAGLAAHLAAEHGAAFGAPPPAPAVQPARLMPALDAAAPIAIIGLGLSAPGAGADGVRGSGAASTREGWTARNAFWQALKAGRHAITDIPADRWNGADPALFDADKARAVASGRAYARWGGFLEGGIDRFDALFFGISPREAELMDPQERLFLEVAWQTVEDAGLTRAALAGQNVAVFAGAMFGHYQLFESASGIPNSSFASIANRVSHMFDWRGPSLAVDTMCSSALAAIALACASLRRGESALALAGGVNLISHPRRYALLSQGRFASTDGRCRAFGEGGDGYVPGEGAGAVLLKPLDAALRDGDPVWGVIRGIGMNHGGRSAGSGFTVPSPVAQSEAIAQALSEAGLAARDISYVEAHGTGTALGDPVELAGLARGYGDAASRDTVIALGAVKSNIGHLEAAAGIAGLAKVLMGLREGVLVPSLPHAETLNPHCDFEGAGFALQRNCAPWIANGAPRRAGLSAFGAGGTNVHLVIEEAPARAQTAVDVPVFVPLSAPSEPQLIAAAGALADWIEATGGEDAPAAPLATLTSIAARVLGLAEAEIDPDDTLDDCGFDPVTSAALARELAALLPLPPGPLSGTARLRDLVPGPAREGTGPSLAALAATLQSGREVFDERAAFVVASLAELKAALRRFVAEGPRARPATAPPEGAALAALLRQADPAALAEAFLAGADMAFAAPHGTPRLNLPGLPFRRVRHWIAPALSAEPAAGGHMLIAGNASGWEGIGVRLRLAQATFLHDHVVAGSAILPGAALAEIAFAAARETGAPTLRILRDIAWRRPLPLDRPSRLDLKPDGANARLELATDAGLHASALADFSAPAEVPPLAVDAARARCTRRLDPARLYDGLAGHGLVYGPAFRALETLAAGDGEALATLRRPAAAPAGLPWHPAMLDAALQATVALLSEDGGLPHGAEAIELLAPLPDTCLVHVRRRAGSADPTFDLLLAREDGAPLVRITGLRLKSAAPAARKAAPDLLFLRPDWIAAGPASARARGPVLLIAPPRGLPDAFAAAGAEPRVVAREEEIAAALAALPPGPVRALIWLRPERPLAWPMALCQAMLSGRPGDRLDLVCTGDELEAEALAGFARSLRLETPRLALRTLRLPATLAPEAEAAALLAELSTPGDDALVRLTPHGRQARRLGEITPPPPARWLTPGATCLITGGAGGVGALVAGHLARSFGARIALTGRSKQDERIARLLDRLKAEGAADAVYLPADISQAEEVATLVAAVRARFGPLGAVLHAAGITRDGLLPRKSRADAEAVLAPKIAGTRALDAATRDDPLQAFVLFSSVCAELGNRGQTDYAFANAWLDAFAARREGERAQGGRAGRTRSINWPLWDEGGMRPDAAALGWMKAELGLAPLRTADALDALDRAMADDAPQMLVLAGDVERLRARILPPVPAQQPAAAPQPARTEAGDVVEAVLQALVAALHIPRADLRADVPLERYGLNSVTALEVVAALEPRFGALPATLLLEHPTAEAVAGALAASQPTPPQARPLAAPPAPAVHQAAPPPMLNGQDDSKEPIAIIGAAGRFPDADDLDAFWQNLAAGHDAIGLPPAGRLPGGEALRGGYLGEVETFDPLFFGISPREATHLSPETRLFLTSAWQALESAGLPRAATTALQASGAEIGVYVAAMYQHYPFLAPDLETAAQLASGGPWMIANRTSHALDLRGPSLALDAACAGALSAVHEACEALHRNGCTVAIAGGVNLTLHPAKYAALGALGLLERGAQSRPLGAGTGMVPGEGVGAVVLQRLSQAQAAGRPILGLIRASAVNHGGRRNGRAFNAPDAEAQAIVVARALAQAGIAADTLTCLELAANGAPLGDAAEMEAMARAFRAAGDGRGPGLCAVGSAKSGIGHLEAASGMAGLAKLIGQFRHKALAPTLNSEPRNPALKLEDTPFRPQTTLAPWQPTAGMPRRAGLASFGAGGSNAFLVLEEPPESAATPAGPGDTLFLLSARDVEGLAAYAGRLRAALEENLRETPLIDIAFTLQTACKPLEHRLALLAGDRDTLLALLAAAAEQRPGLLCGVAEPRMARLFGEAEAGALGADPERLAALWVAGADLPWQRLFWPRGGRITPLPPRPLRKQRFWLEGAPTVAAAPAPGPAPAPAPTPGGGLRALVADLLKLDPADIDPDRDLRDYGLDSLMAMQILARLEEDTGCRLTPLELFDAPTLSAIAARAAAPEARAAQAPLPDAIGRAMLTPGQEALWRLRLRQPSHAAHNLPCGFRLRGPLDLEALRQAWGAVVGRHDALRLVFTTDADGVVTQEVAALPARFAVHDATGLAEPALTARMMALGARPFALEQDGPARLDLLRVGEEDHALLLTFHNIAFDGLSLSLVLADLTRAYAALRAGGGPDLPSPPASFAAFARLPAADGAPHLAFWRQALAQMPAPLLLPTDRPRPTVPGLAGALQKIEIAPGMTQALKALARAEGVTLFAVMGAAYLALLHRRTGQTDLALGTLGHGRSDARFERTVGCFANLFPLRVRLDPQAGARALMADVQHALLSALPHAHLPLAQVLAALFPQADAAGLAEAYGRVGFGFQSHATSLEANTAEEAMEAARAKGRLVLETLTGVHQTGGFDLSLTAVEAQERLLLFFKYDSDLFDGETIAGLAAEYQAILAGFIGPEGPFESLPAPAAPAPSPPLPRKREREPVTREETGHARVVGLPEKPSPACGGGLGGGKTQPADFQPPPEDATPERPGFAQERLWFLHQLDPASTRYTVPTALDMAGDLDRPALERALTALVARHESLRTRFPADADGQALCIVDPPAPFVLPYINLEGADEAAAHAAITEAAQRPFALDRDLMLRALLLRLSSRRHVLALLPHHIAVDGWSIGILISDLSALYMAEQAGTAHGLPAAPQPRTAARAERAYMASEASQADADWWAKRLAGAPDSHELPLDRPRPATPSGRGGLVEVPLAPGFAQRLAGFARQAGATGFMVLLAACHVALHRWSGARDLVIGTPVAGRGTQDFGTVGLLLNTLALRAHVDGTEPFRALLGRVQAGTLEALGRARLPFDRVVERAGTARRSGMNPLFQVMLSYENTPKPEARLGGLALSRFDLPADEAKFDLTFDIEAVGTHFAARIEYDADLFAPATAQRFARQFGHLLEAILADADAPIGTLPLDVPDVLHACDEAGRGPVLAVSGTLPEAFCAQASASIDGEAPLAPDALKDWVAELAGRLVERGVGPGVRVGLALDRSPALVAAMMAVWQAGGASVPLDPTGPLERLAFMLTDAAPACVIAEPEAGRRLVMEAGMPPDALLAPRGGAPVPMQEPRPRVGADDPAYVIYTSGSTGQPKGVVVSHGNLANLCAAVIARDALVPDDRVLNFASPLFDVAVEEIAPTLWRGATLVPWPAHRDGLEAAGFAAFVARHRVSVLNLPTAYWHSLVEADLILPPCVRLLIVGGEAPAAAMLRRWRALNPAVTFINAYGPTEATVTATAWTLRPGESLPEDAISLPIGRPLANVTAHILDADLTPVAPGVAGDLWIGGAGVAAGYLGRPDLTEAAFRPDPAVPGGRLYRTGDRARWTETLQMEFLGRQDHQVKVRGFRIELGEVEAALSAHPAVGEAIVTLARRGPEAELVGWYTAEDGTDAADIRRHLAGHLAPAAIPGRLVRLDEMPQTAGGKIDRGALAARPLPDAAPVAALAPEEEPMAMLWADLLGHQAIGPEDDFFALGGHSLLAVRLAHRLGAERGRPVPVALVLRHPTVRALTQALAQAPLPATALPRPETLESRGDGAPLLLMPGGDGHGVAYLALAAALGRARPVLTFDLPGVSGEAPPMDSIPALAAHYRAALAAAGHEPGDLWIGGWSMGAAIALELAHQFTQAGTPPRGLILMDGFLADALPDDGRAKGALAGLAATPAAVLAANEAALAAYRPTFRLDVAVHALEPEQGLDDAERADVRASWAARLVQPLAVALTPGHHFSMLKPPHVTTLAARLATVLEDAAARAEPVPAE
ncbi:amino acid adenylation domain-containing protein [Xanthobacteraceae bacterium A53D]